MSDVEIREWEARAQTGLLQRDTQLRQMISDMRATMGVAVRLEGGGQFSLANMGIRLTNVLSEGAVLTIDEEQLTAALENNIEAVTALFTGTGAAEGQVGLGARLDQTLNRFVTLGGNGLLDRRVGSDSRPHTISQSTMGRQMASQDTRIENMMRWLERRESALFAQFSRMEQAMMQGQQQMMFWDQIMWGAM
jgi:flagellar hook-associated protein 2